MKDFNLLSEKEQKIVNSLIKALAENKTSNSSLSFVDDMMKEKNNFLEDKKLNVRKNNIVLTKYMDDLANEIKLFNLELNKVGIKIEARDRNQFHIFSNKDEKSYIASFHITSSGGKNHKLGNESYTENPQYHLDWFALSRENEKRDYSTIKELLESERFKTILWKYI